MLTSIYLLLVSFVASSYQLNNGLGRKPQMGKIKITNCSIFGDVGKANTVHKYDASLTYGFHGWNSWDYYRFEVDEKSVRESVDILVATGLAALGYEYINLDDCWAGSRDAQGNIQPDSKLFPSGMAALADYIHSKKLKFGIYSDAGYKTCSGRTGSLRYETKDANTYASWNVDYLKYDNCYSDGTMPADRYPIMRDALNATGRPIFFSMCEWGLDQPALWAKDVGNSWRSTEDLQETWLSTLDNIDINNEYADKAGPGGWNDPDIMNVGRGALTAAEDLANFCLWAISKAPLLIGGDIHRMNNDTLATLSNPEVIAVSQDPLGVQGKKVAFALSQLSNTSSNVIISNCSNSIDPRRLRWLYNNDDGSIRSVYNGQCLSIEGCSTTKGANIVVSDCHIGDMKAPCSGKNQQWTVAQYHQDITSQLDGLCLALYNFVGPHLNAFSCDIQDDQAWIFDSADGTVRNKLNNQCLTVEAELEVWAGPLSNGSQAVLLFNRGNTGSEPITVKWSDIGFSVDQSANVRDLIARKDLGTFTGSYTSPNIDHHAVMMLKMTPTK